MGTTKDQWAMRWPNFTREEMTCRCGCGLCEIDPELMDILEIIRKQSGKFPLPVTSGHRCLRHQTKVSYEPIRGDWEHNGHAVDIQPRSQEHAYAIVEAAMRVDGDGLYINGIGLKLHGPVNDRFIHLHRWKNKPFKMWTYPK